MSSDLQLLKNTSFYIACCYFALMTSSCSVTQPAFRVEPLESSKLQIVERERKVSVKTGGKDYQESSGGLVHYIDLSQQQLRRAFARRSGGTLVPFSIRTKRDAQGKSEGLLIERVAPGAEVLGLRKGDLITALGRQHATKKEQFLSIYQSLQREGRASLTLKRANLPHKLLYFSVH